MDLSKLFVSVANFVLYHRVFLVFLGITILILFAFGGSTSQKFGLVGAGLLTGILINLALQNKKHDNLS